LVVPGRLRVRLADEVHPVDAVEERRGDLDPGRAADRPGERAAEGMADVDLPRLYGGGTGGLVGNATHDQALHAGHLAPVLRVGLEGELDSRLEGDDLVRARAHRGFLVGLLTDLLDVLFGHDPRRARGRGAVERPRAGPGFVER